MVEQAHTIVVDEHPSPVCQGRQLLHVLRRGYYNILLGGDHLNTYSREIITMTLF